MNRITRRDCLLALLLLAVALCCAVYRMAPQLCGSFHDDGIYVAMAKGICEGNGYNLVNLPMSPPQTKYPFIYPYILSLLWCVFPQFPQNLFFLQSFSALCGASAIALAYLLLVRFNYVSSTAAFLGVLFCATSSTYTYFTSMTLPDGLFSLALVAVLWLAELLLGRLPEDVEHNEKRLVGTSTFAFAVGLAIGALFELRMNGIAVLPAVLIMAVVRRRHPLPLMLGAAVSCAPWALWVGWHSLHKNAADTMAYYTDYGGYLGSASAWAAVKNLLYLLVDTARGPLEGPSLAIAGVYKTLAPLADIVISLAAWTVILMAYIRHRRVLPFVLIFFVALLIVWPWPLSRYIVPLMSLTMPFACEVVLNALTKVRLRPLLTTLCLAGVAALLGANCWMLWFYRQCYEESKYLYYMPPSGLVQWSCFERTFAWMRQHATASDVIACTLDPMHYLYTGLPAFRPFVPNPGAICFDSGQPGIGTVEQLSETLEKTKTRYLVSLPMVNFGENAYWPQLIADYKRLNPRARLVFTDSDARFFILELPLD